MLFWILGILLLLILLICLLQVRILVQMGTSCIVSLRIGPVKRQIYPPQKSQKKPKEIKSEKKKEKRAFLKPTFSDIRDALQTLKPVLIRALHRTRRGVRVDPLDLSLILGGRDDPAGTVEMYGYISAAVWTFMPALEQLLVIPAPHIHLDMDFDAEKLRLEGTAGIRARIGTLLMIAFGVAIPVIRWFVAFTKQAKQRQEQPSPQAAA